VLANRLSVAFAATVGPSANEAERMKQIGQLSHFAELLLDRGEAEQVIVQRLQKMGIDRENAIKLVDSGRHFQKTKNHRQAQPTGTLKQDETDGLIPLLSVIFPPVKATFGPVCKTCSFIAIVVMVNAPPADRPMMCWTLPLALAIVGFGETLVRAHLNYRRPHASGTGPAALPSTWKSLPDQECLRLVARWVLFVAIFLATGLGPYLAIRALRPGLKEVESHLERARAHLKAREADHVIRECDEALHKLGTESSRPGSRGGNLSAEIHTLRGVAYVDKEELDKALADFDEAIQSNPQYAKAYFGRGIAYRSKGDRARAQADFLRANLLDPKLVPEF
jgi:tetratricopeptide (TPR) repeat protein